MPNQNSFKHLRARRFKSPQSNKKQTNFVVEIFFNNIDVPGFRKNITTKTKTINIHVLPSTYLCEH